MMEKSYIPADNLMFKVNIGNTRARREIHWTTSERQRQYDANGLHISNTRTTPMA